MTTVWHMHRMKWFFDPQENPPAFWDRLQWNSQDQWKPSVWWRSTWVCIAESPAWSKWSCPGCSPQWQHRWWRRLRTKGVEVQCSVWFPSRWTQAVRLYSFAPFYPVMSSRKSKHSFQFLLSCISRTNSCFVNNRSQTKFVRDLLNERIHYSTLQVKFSRRHILMYNKFTYHYF